MRQAVNRINRSLLYRLSVRKKKYMTWTKMERVSDVHKYGDNQLFLYYKDDVLSPTPCYGFNLVALFNLGVEISFTPFNHK